MPPTTAAIPCTCGELFQGSLEGEPCLVSCPINIYSSARFSPDGVDNGQCGSKVRQALEKLPLSRDRFRPISIRNPLPAGRGYGTSTADIGAALYLLSTEMGLNLAPLEVSRLALEIEPTDSTLLPGLSLFAHRSGVINEALGPAPAARVLILDPGGFVDTRAFNARDWRPQLVKLSVEHLQAFQLLKNGIQSADLRAVGEACTLDARLHQELLFNPLLDKALSLCREIGASGVCRAHSGTLLGLLLEGQADDDGDVIDFCKKRLPDCVQIISTSLANGGPRISVGTEWMQEELQM